MIGKFVYFLVLLVSIAAVANAKSAGFVENYAPDDTRPSHHLEVGARTPYDRLVVNESVIKPSSILQIVKITKTFYTLNEKNKITLVRALDQKTNGKGAYASLLAGGPGANNVTLQFKSQRGHGINFIVEVYAE